MLHDLLLVSDSLPRMQIAFGPLMFGPLSEIYGRSRVLQLANLIYFGMPSSPLSPVRISRPYFFYDFPSVPYLRLLTPHLSISSARRPMFFWRSLVRWLEIAFNLACGFAQNKGQLIALRFLAGLGGSAPLSVRLSPFLVLPPERPFQT